MKGQVSVIGLFVFFGVAIFFISFAPGIAGIVTSVLSGQSVDPFTTIALCLIIPTVLYGLWVGLNNSFNSGG